MHSMLGIAPARGRCYKKHSMHFAPQNKEENPLLAKGLAFSFGKQGGFYVKQIIDSG